MTGRFRGSYIRNAAIFTICLICFTATLFPFYWMLVSSFKKASEIFSSPPTFIPKIFTLENYFSVWTTSAIPRYFLNTVIVASFTVLIVLFFSSMASYSVSRFRFKGKKVFLLSLLLAQVMPLTTLIIPLYIFWTRLKLLDSYISLIATYSSISIPVGTWLLLGFINGIPRQLDEAATIDGANSGGIFFRIIIPLLKPGLMATGLTVLIYVWQELMISMTFISTDKMKTLMAGVSTFITSRGISWGPLTASGVLSIIPILMLYMLFQKALIRGLTSGAVKG